MKKNEMKKGNKGFTLVELIVVLVILAILAAILVPALLGYIDNARSKQTLLNARSAMTAAQAELSAIYGSNSAKPEDIAAPEAGKTSQHNDNLINTADLKNLSPTVLQFDVACWDTYPAKLDDDKTRKDYHDAFTVCWVYYKDETSEVWYNGATGEWSDTEVKLDAVKKDGKTTKKHEVYKKK